MKEREGYVVVEAAVLLPAASVIILLLVWLCSYLYQGCFLQQAAYISAFRGSRYAERGEAYVEAQLDEIMEGEILRFEPEQRTVKAGMLIVQVELERGTPFPMFNGQQVRLHAVQRAAVRDPVGYIRGIRILGGLVKDE